MGRILLSICAVVVAVGLSGAQQQPESPAERPGRGGQQTQSNERDGDYHGALREIAGAIKETAPSPQSDTEKKDAKDDVQAQREMAYWASVLGWLTAAQLVIGFFGTVFLIRSFNLSRTSNQQQLRAYLATKIMEFGPLPAGSPLHATVVLDNMGQTPVQGLLLVAGVNVVPRPPGPSVYAECLQIYPTILATKDALGGGESFGTEFTYTKERQVEATGMPLPFTAAERAAVVAGTHCILFSGRAYYEDVFGGSHWVDWGFYVWGAGFERMRPQSARGFNKISRT